MDDNAIADRDSAFRLIVKAELDTYWKMNLRALDHVYRSRKTGGGSDGVQDHGEGEDKNEDARSN